MGKRRDRPERIEKCPVCNRQFRIEDPNTNIVTCPRCETPLLLPEREQYEKENTKMFQFDPSKRRKPIVEERVVFAFKDEGAENLVWDVTAFRDEDGDFFFQVSGMISGLPGTILSSDDPRDEIFRKSAFDLRDALRILADRADFLAVDVPEHMQKRGKRIKE